MNRHSHLRVFRFLSLVFLLALGACDNSGPGLGNLTYTSDEVFKSVSIVHSPQRGSRAQGEGAVAMHNGYLVVMYAPDSGRTNGGFSFYDVSNPRAPKQVYTSDPEALPESNDIR